MNPKNTKTKSFEDSDCMNLKAFADHLFNNIQIDNLLSENSVVISLNAKFGMGKSYFLEMFENYLKDEKQAETILINSWKNDFCDEPLIAICSEIIKYLQEKTDKKSISICKQFISLIGIFGDISNQYIDNITGLNFKEIYDKNKHSIDGNKIYEQFIAKRNLFDKLNHSIAEYTAKKQLIILIDELDRTRPDYAINFLETLKHFFDVKGLIFILAVNKEQLKQSVECVYGKIDFDEYYRKFAHRDISLPYSERGINSFIIKTVDDFFNKIEVDGKKIGIEKNALKDEGFTLKVYIKEFFIKFKLSPRQINQFFRIFLSLLISETNSITFGYQIASIVYIVIDLYDSEIAKKILNDQFNYIDILNFLESKNFDLVRIDYRMAKNLLYLFSNARKDVNSNIEFFKNKFNGKIEFDPTTSESQLELGGYNEDSISPIKSIGKKVLQSKKLFDQL